MTSFGLIPIFAVVLIIWYFLRTTKHAKRKMNTKWIYVFFATYVFILVIATVVVGILDKKTAAETPKQIPVDSFYSVDIALQAGDLSSIDSSQIIDKRTHRIGDMLTITSKAFDLVPNVYIERKDVNDGLIEETIFKPFLAINNYDFSEQMNYTKPKWENGKMTLVTPSFTEITYTSYQEAFLLDQFTGATRRNFGSHSSDTRQITVYLRVPKDLIVKTDDHVSVDYVTD
ncbi:hypothetical protein FITA111629_06000 [Filibacter tadaridae]|uniref:Uncharacterized protein n=1 Tax=Filibacter tadaridae TaxID=2483811 RepID=A0A3P5WL98_9BACL|nr:hypothetical protein [Filibacter tadaridae]VDC19325.1 hypothetical protein FILTAD_00261 [Filibacter tadaridae]